MHSFEDGKQVKSSFEQKKESCNMGPCGSHPSRKEASMSKGKCRGFQVGKLSETCATGNQPRKNKGKTRQYILGKLDGGY